MAEYIEREVAKKVLRFGVGATAAEALDKVSVADVAPVVHGRWEETFFTNARQRVCSACHCTVRQPSYDRLETALFKYCPNCGAKMDGGAG